jgi:hypothetical protein
MDVPGEIPRYPQVIPQLRAPAQVAALPVITEKSSQAPKSILATVGAGEGALLGASECFAEGAAEGSSVGAIW